jgi:hypothetical protein
MKYLVIAFISIFTTTAFASDLASTIKEIEMNKNAKCTQTSTSMGVCLTATCFYSVKFECVSNSGDFDLKVKMKSIPGKTTVRKVIFLN